MAPLEVEITISSAKDLKNVNWRHGNLKPYAIVWVDPVAKCSTRVDDRNDTSPYWDEKLTIPLHDRRVEDSTLYIDVIHANAQDSTKPLIGSARVPLKEVVDQVGLRNRCTRSLNLKRPSGRPHGKLEVVIEVRELRYYEPPVAYAPPYGQASRDYQAPGYAYGAPPQVPYGAPPPSGYPYNAAPAYNAPAYAAPLQEEKKKGGKFGVGKGAAVGAAAGLLGGLAIGGGVSSLMGSKKEGGEGHGYDGDDYGGDDYY